MKKTVLILTFLLSLQTISAAEVGIFVKIAVDNTHYSSLVVKKPENLQGKFKFIARKIKENTFNFAGIQKDFYQVNIRHEMTYMKTPMKIYELNPAFNDRFIQVVWVVDDLIVRRETYNLDKKLMSAYGYVDGLPEMVLLEKEKQVDSGEAYLKDNFNIIKFEYKGFRIMSGKHIHDGIQHILFTDGLNKFSVFIQQIPAEFQEKKFAANRIVMGNNILRGKMNNELFTVVGTIPFKEMKQIIQFVDQKKEELRK